MRWCYGVIAMNIVWWVMIVHPMHPFFLQHLPRGETVAKRSIRETSKRRKSEMVVKRLKSGKEQGEVFPAASLEHSLCCTASFAKQKKFEWGEATRS